MPAIVIAILQTGIAVTRLTMRLRLQESANPAKAARRPAIPSEN
jgi:hypothetical protein